MATGTMVMDLAATAMATTVAITVMEATEVAGGEDGNRKTEWKENRTGT